MLGLKVCATRLAMRQHLECSLQQTTALLTSLVHFLLFSSSQTGEEQPEEQDAIIL